jgi:fibronectin-binding autotransporter adhesin
MSLMVPQHRIRAIALALTLILLGSPSSQAQTNTWTNPNGGNWNTNGNWSLGTFPNAVGANATFGNAISTGQTVTLSSGVTVGVLTFDNAVASYTVTGSSITLNNGGAGAQINVTNTTTDFQNLNTNLSLAEDLTITNNIGGTSKALVLGGTSSTLTFNGHNLTVNGSGQTNFGSNLFYSSPGTVTKNGSGLLLLLAGNLTAPKFVINGGVVEAFGNSSLGQPGSVIADAVTINNGATLRLDITQNSSNNIGIVLGTGGGQIDVPTGKSASHAGVITGTSLTKTGGGALILSATNTYTGTTTVLGGTLRVDANAPAGANGTLGNATSAVNVGDPTGLTNTALLVGANGVTVGRDITVVGPAGAAGTVTLGGDTFAPSTGAAFTGLVTLNRDVLLQSNTTSGSISFGRITGTGGITKVGSGAITLSSTASDFVGTVTLKQGTTIISADSQLGAAGNALVMFGGTLQVTGSSPVSTNRTVTLQQDSANPPNFGGGFFDIQNTDTVSGFTINSAMTGAGDLRKLGPGILTFGAAGSTFSGKTDVQAGTLRVTGTNFLSPNSTLRVTNGALVQLNGFSQAVALLEGSGTSSTINLGSAGSVLTIGGTGSSSNSNPLTTTNSFTGTITGNGGLVKVGLGMQQIGSTNSDYTGNTIIRQGTIEVTSNVPATGALGPLGNPSSGGTIHLGDAANGGFDAALLTTDTTFGGFARPITVDAGSGFRTLGSLLKTNGPTVTFSGAVTLNKDVNLIGNGDTSNSNIPRTPVIFSGPLSGVGGVIKVAPGDVQLSAANGYTGATTVLNGRLILNGASGSALSTSGFTVTSDPRTTVQIGLNFSQNLGITRAELVLDNGAADNPNRIADTASVTLNNGNFTYLGRFAGSSAETINNLVLNSGANIVTIARDTSTSTSTAVLTVGGNLVRNDRSQVVFQGDSFGGTGAGFGRLILANGVPLVGGGGPDGMTNISIVPHAFYDPNPGSSTVAPLSFVTYNSTAGLRPLGSGEYVSSLTAPGTLNNVRLTAGTTLTQDQTINALHYNSNTAGTIDLSSHTLTVNSGAILATGNLTFTGGTLNFGAAEGIIHVSLAGGAATTNVTINSVITGSGGLTSNTSSLTLNGVNLYTGPTTLNAGGVFFNNASAFGAGPEAIRFRNWTGGGMTYTGTTPVTIDKPIEIAPGGTGLSTNNGGTLTVTGVISGGQVADPLLPTGLFVSAGSGAVLLRGANTFLGNVQMNSGLLGINSDANFGDPTNKIFIGNVSNSPVSTLRFDAGGINVNRTIQLLGTTVLNTNGFDATIAGPLIGGNSTAVLTKAGAGTLTLTGTSNYLAATVVSGGTLMVNGTLASVFGNSAVTVQGGAGLGGSGNIQRAVTLQNNSSLNPGASPGTLTVGSLAFDPGATITYNWEAGPTAADSVVVSSGPLDLTGRHFNLNLIDAGLGSGVMPSQMFPLFTAPGAGSILGFDKNNWTVNFAQAPNWRPGVYDLLVGPNGSGTSVFITGFQPTPEPAWSLTLVAAASAAAGWWRARRARRKSAAS